MSRPVRRQCAYPAIPAVVARRRRSGVDHAGLVGVNNAVVVGEEGATVGRERQVIHEVRRRVANRRHRLHGAVAGSHSMQARRAIR